MTRVVRNLFIAVAIAFAIAASAQTTLDDQKPVADAWMKEPTPYLAWNSGISPELRAARDLVWDAASPSDLPLTGPGSGRPTGCDYDMTSETSEIPSHLDHRVILTGTFTDHRSVLSKSEWSLYSEVTVRVDKVYEDKAGESKALAGRNITLGIFGGTVRLGGGRVFSVKNTCARPDLFIQPGHKYLFVLDYSKNGDFFDYAESWDITDGTVRPSSPYTLYFAQGAQGFRHSALAGIKVEQLDAVMEKELHRQEQPTNDTSR